MRTRHLFAILGMTMALIGLSALYTQAQFESRDKRFYQRAAWNFALRDNLPELDIEFNGVDFGHSNLYENLLLTGAKSIPAIEDQARRQTLRFIYSRPVLPPNEEAIAPTYMKLAWRAQNTFDEAHTLHRATYDIYVSDTVADKDSAVRAALAYYQQSPYAITARQLDHQRLDSLPFSKSSRRKFPLFNATIWAYHYLQVAVYDVLAAAPDMESKKKAARPILATYHGYLQQPPVQWTFMPLTAELSPKFAAQSIRKTYDIGWKPMTFVNNVSTSVATVLQPAGLEKSTGLITALYFKDPTDPQWANDPSLKLWHDWMKKYYPEGDIKDGSNIYAYAAAQTMAHVLKQCGDDLSHENIMRQAARLKDLEIPVLLPGIRINTGSADFYPIEQVQLARFDGKRWVLFGEVIGK